MNSSDTNSTNDSSHSSNTNTNTTNDTSDTHDSETDSSITHNNSDTHSSNTQNSSSNTDSSNTSNNSGTNTTNSQNNSTTIYINETIDGVGFISTNNQTLIQDTSVTTTSTFTTTDQSNHVPQINENLNENVEYEYDDNIISATDNIVNEIRHYATQIKCEDFHGKGSIDDYAALFQAASQIANETRQMQLDIDVDGFNDFGQAADDLSLLFTNFTKKLQSINIIDDTAFLQAVLNALKKIYNLSEVFGRFKETILVTSEIKIPKTSHDTKDILVNVMDEVNCSLNYINNFVNPDENLVNAQLSDADKNIINKAVVTIEHWHVLCDQGVSIAMTTNTDMQFLTRTNTELKQKTTIIRNATSALQAKLQQMGL